jgi:hypothetical protein
VIVLKTILKFTLKQLRHVSLQSHHLQGAHCPCLLMLHFVKTVSHGSSVCGYISGHVAAPNVSVLADVCMVISVVTWLHVLHVSLLYVALFGSSVKITETECVYCAVRSGLYI